MLKIGPFWLFTSRELDKINLTIDRNYIYKVCSDIRQEDRANENAESDLASD